MEGAITMASPASNLTPLEAILRRDRTIVLAALTAVILMSWAYVLAGAGMGMTAFDMSSLELALGRAKPMAMGGGAMAAMATPAGWTLGYAGIMVVMWWVMMIAMMLPSAAPMILLYAAIDRRQRSAGRTVPLPAGIFAAGYIAAWGGFSVIATASQWGLEHVGILSPKMMNTTSLLFAGVLLVAAGIYQLSPLKRACLSHCRSPLQFLTGYWRSGRWGAFRMGVEHGAFCLGCCWGLMALLFLGGVMNLYWIAGLALLVGIEKLVPAGDVLAKVIGGLLALWGATFLYSALA
jgi:predicted metal-binding membrane protein